MSAGDAGLETQPPRRKSYASAQIHQRRARILAEALALIMETGSTGFTIQELSRRADVAPRTLYYGFGDKEGIIESAVLEHFSELSRRYGLTPAHPDARSVIAGIEVSLAEIFRVPNYARAMVDVYFSPSANLRIVAALKSISSGLPAAWLRVERQAGRLARWVEDDLFLEQLSDLQYAAIHTWSIGEIGDAELWRRMRANFVSLAQGALTDEGRRALDEALSSPDVNQNRR